MLNPSQVSLHVLRTCQLNFSFPDPGHPWDHVRTITYHKKSLTICHLVPGTPETAPQVPLQSARQSMYQRVCCSLGTATLCSGLGRYSPVCIVDFIEFGNIGRKGEFDDPLSTPAPKSYRILRHALCKHLGINNLWNLSNSCIELHSNPCTLEAQPD